jgi:gliding motility-associated-like protein
VYFRLLVYRQLPRPPKSYVCRENLIFTEKRFFYLLLPPVKKILKYSLAVLLTLFVVTAFGQQRGQIITPANTAIMDPNQDGYVSKTTSGFTDGLGYWVPEFEINMHGIPKLGGDVPGDNIGQPCGITDMIPDRDGYSVYAARDDNNNLIFRFRVGSNNPSVEAWTILLDTDGLFGADDPNATVNNPGFEIDITLIKRNNAGVFVYNIDGIESCPSPLFNYPIASHFQISVADETSCGNPDYFYDFFVPFADIAAAFGIDVNTGLRYVAVTNVSATCAMAGKIADISGVDYDDYKTCVPCAFTELVEAQCPTAVEDLCETCEGFNSGLPTKPTINEPIRAGQEVISGTAEDGTFIKLWVYPRIGGTDAEPIWSTTAREEHTVPVTDATWSVTLNDPLVAYDRIVARAQLNAEGTGCGTAGGNEASTTSVTVVEPNEAPVAEDQVVEVIEDTPKDIFLVATDPDGDDLTYTIVTPPQHGVLTGTGPNVTYTPNQDYNGPDSFTFQVSDGVLLSNVATVTINVLPVNDAPVANDQSVTTLEDTPKDITLTGSDIDNTAAELTYIIVSLPTNGTLTDSNDNPLSVGSQLPGTAPDLIYIPTADFNGGDSFTFKINDGEDDSNVATVTITVTPVNDPPVIPDCPVAAIEVQEDSDFADNPITLSGFDIDGDDISYIIVSGPSNGVLDGTGADRFYKPNADFFGADSFTYKVSDGDLESGNCIINIDVINVNDPPVISTTSPSNTTEYEIGGVIVDSNLQVDDIDNTTLVGVTVRISTNFEVGDVLEFADQSGITHVYDGNTGILTLTGTATLAQYSAAIASIRFENDGASGATKRITFVANDGEPVNNLSAEFHVFINFPGNLNPPVGTTPQLFVTQEDTPKVFCLVVTDEDGDALAIDLISNPVNGTFQVSDPDSEGNLLCFLYTPPQDFNGTATATITVCDVVVPQSERQCVVIDVIITVEPDNDPPATLEDVIEMNEDNDPVLPTAVIDILANDTDVDSDIVPSTVDLNPSIAGIQTTFSVANKGTFRIVSTTATECFVTFDPVENYFNTPPGDDLVIGFYTVQDAEGATSSPTKISVIVHAINDAPIAYDDGAATNEEEPVGITLTGSDVDNTPAQLTYIIVSVPANGTLSGGLVAGSTLSGTDPSLTYVPNTGFFGSDSFTFKISDGDLESNTATITITVNPVNYPPVINCPDVSEPVEVLEDSDFADNPIVLDASDVNEGDVLTYEILSGPSHGELSGTAPNLFYKPVADYYGPDSFSFRVFDGTVYSEICVIHIEVINVNDAPVIAPFPIRYFPEDFDYDSYDPEDLDFLICLSVTDIDGPGSFGPPFIYDAPINLIGGGTMTPHGSLTHCFIFKPDLNMNGRSNWTMRACDQGGLCDETVVQLIVTPVNDPPIGVNDELTVQGHVATSFNVLLNDLPITASFKEFYDIYEIDSGFVDVLVLDNIIAGPFHGNLTWEADGTIVYTSNFEFMGQDSVKYRVCDAGDPALLPEGYTPLCDTAVVFIEVGPPPFKIYEALSPNGDGLNDYWRIDGIEDFPDNHIRVFDRYGNLVYETRGYQNQDAAGSNGASGNYWHGQANRGLIGGTLPEGTYFYAVDLGDGSAVISGYVVLKLK